jgi:glycosyltransferase involved in cell wall biosynthesis
MTPRPRIAIVVDVAGWAFYNVAEALQKHLADQFDIRIFSVSGFRGNLAALLIAVHEFDLVHFLWRETLLKIAEGAHRVDISRLGWEYDEFVNRFHTWDRFTTAICDHLYLEPETIERRLRVLREVRSYYVISSRLEPIYRSLDGAPPPAAVVPHGVDLSQFRSGAQAESNQQFIVGWAGNSAWNATEGDPKGLHTVLEPAFEKVKEKHADVLLVKADRQSVRVPRSLMPDYYAALNVFTCTSASEGTPNPVLEAMASSVPIVTTDVGIVPEALGPLQRRFIVERTPESFAAALERLYRDRGLLRELAQENASQIQPWDWSVRAPAHAEFFAAALGRG